MAASVARSTHNRGRFGNPVEQEREPEWKSSRTPRVPISMMTQANISTASPRSKFKGLDSGSGQDLAQTGKRTITAAIAR